MPEYEFECTTCDTRFDVQRAMAEASAPCPCPFCGEAARRIFSTPQLTFTNKRGAIGGGPGAAAPVRHSHGGYGHSHAPGQGFHGSHGSHGPRLVKGPGGG
jgi:putative FmdB family regulatory protein